MGRGKNKQKQQPQVIHIEELEIENKVDIDYDKLAQAISKAMLMHEQEKEVAQKKQKEEYKQKRDEALGRKDYSHEKNRLVRIVKKVWNTICVFFRILFISKKKAKYLSAVNGLFQSVTEGVFASLRYGMYFLTIVLVFRGFAQEQICAHCIYAVLAFVYGQIFRLAQFEVAEMKDKEYLLAVFAALISVISLIVSIFMR